MIDEILVSAGPGETRSALLANGRLVELLVDRSGPEAAVGSIYLGRVERVLPGLDAAFVELGHGRAGFLGRDDAQAPGLRGEGDGPLPISRCVHEGEAVLVQVIKPATGNKGPAVTRRIGLPGRYLVLTPGRPCVAVSRRIDDEAECGRLLAAVTEITADEGAGFVVRTAAWGAEPATLAAEASELTALWEEVSAAVRGAAAPSLVHREPGAAERVLRDHAGDGLVQVVIDDRAALDSARRFCARVAPALADRFVLHDGKEPLFARHDVEAQIAAALAPRARMASGATLVIETLEALTAIDVNTARNEGAGSLDDTVRAVNLEAAVEAARQIRLRNIAGLIVIDFIRMDDEGDRQAVLAALRAAVADDPMGVQVGTMSTMGLVELTRRRGRRSLADVLTEPCAVCAGGGRVAATEAVALAALRTAVRDGRGIAGGRLVLYAAPEVVAALDGPLAPARAQAEAALGRPIACRGEPDYARERYDIQPDPGQD